MFLQCLRCNRQALVGDMFYQRCCDDAADAGPYSYTRIVWPFTCCDRWMSPIKNEEPTGVYLPRIGENG